MTHFGMIVRIYSSNVLYVSLADELIFRFQIKWCIVPHTSSCLQIQNRARMVNLLKSGSFLQNLLMHQYKLGMYFRRRFDLQNPSRVDRNVEMFLQIEKSLQQSSHEFLPNPKVISLHTC